MKTILITGSSRGIGRGIALAFANEPVNIVLNCKENRSELMNTMNEIKKTNPRVIGFVCDVSSYESTATMFEKIKEDFGPVDTLVNNAGVAYYGLFNQMTPEDWERIIQVNLFSIYNCCRLALDHMIAAKSGCIINISSVWGRVGASCEAVYSSSKGAIDGFTRALAKEVGPSGIRVNAVACGVIDTDMNAQLSADERDVLKDSIPLSRFGNTNEIGEVVKFLASEAASYINGEVITVDGGFV